MLKRFSFLLYVLSCLLVSNRVFAQEISEVIETDAFFYALPENYFEVKVKIQKESLYKGPLADYAGGVTGLSSTIKENKVQYKILSITIEEYARVDRNQLYKLKNSDKRHIFSYLNSGLLDMSSTSPTPPCPPKGGEFPSFGGARGGGGEGEGEVLNRFVIYSADAVMEKYDTTYTYDEIDSILIQTPHITRSLVVKPTKRQAEEAMEQLGKIREARWLLISGDIEVNFSKLDVMLAELQKMENDYLALFGGMLETEEQEYSFVVYPTQKADVFSLPLFRFSTAEGITIKEIGTVSYSLHFKSLISQNELIRKITTDSEKQKKPRDTKGTTVYYRLPHVYTITLLENEKTSQVFGQYPIAQLGEVLSLPKNVKSFQLDVLTGGLKFVQF